MKSRILSWAANPVLEVLYILGVALIAEIKGPYTA